MTKYSGHWQHCRKILSEEKMVFTQPRFRRELNERVNYNKGDVAEAILGAAVAALFMNRPTDKVTQKEVEAVLIKVLKTNPLVTKVDDITKQANIQDNIKFAMAIPKPAMQFITDKSNWSLVTDLFKSAISYVNSDRRLNLQAKTFSRNGKANTIFINSDGTGDQTGTKADIKLFFDGKMSKNQISLKVKGGDQFAQVSGVDFSKQEKLWAGGMGISVSTLKNKYNLALKDYDPKMIFYSRTDAILEKQKSVVKDAARLVYTEAARLINKKLKSNDAAFIENLIDFIKVGVAGDESDFIELVKLEAGKFKKIRFTPAYVQAIKDMKLVAEIGPVTKDPVMQIKDTVSGQKLIQIRLKVEATSSKGKDGKRYKVYPRNYIESGPGLFI